MSQPKVMRPMILDEAGGMKPWVPVDPTVAFREVGAKLEGLLAQIAEALAADDGGASIVAGVTAAVDSLRFPEAIALPPSQINELAGLLSVAVAQMAERMAPPAFPEVMAVRFAEAPPTQPAPIVNVPAFPKLPAFPSSVSIDGGVTVDNVKELAAAIAQAMPLLRGRVEVSNIADLAEAAAKMTVVVRGGGGGGGGGVASQVSLDEIEADIDRKWDRVKAQTFTLNTSGAHAIIAPTAGRRLQIPWFSLQADAGIAGQVVVGVSMPPDMVYEFTMIASQPWVRSQVFEGDIDAPLNVTLDTAKTVRVNVETREIA